MDTLKKRYGYKLGAGFFSVASLGAIQALALRALGPAEYGIFDFLNTFYIEVITFLDMGTSDCFYTKLSKRPRETGLVTFYFIFVMAACAGILLLTAVTVMSPLSVVLWPAIPRRYVFLGAVLGALTWISTSLNKSVDAYGLTIAGEKWRVIQKVLGVVLLAFLIGMNQLSLDAFFVFWHGLMIFLGVAFLWVNAQNGHPTPRTLVINGEDRQRYVSEFYTYSHPLFIYIAVTVMTGVFGRWLLQRFSGSVQQALFGLSEQISSMCALSVRVMTPLLLRDLSIAHHRGDSAGMADTFSRHVPILHSVTIFFACFTAFNAASVVRLLGGTAYVPGETAAMLMSLSAIPQAGSMMSGAVLLANGRTDLYRDVGITTMLVGAALNFRLLAPASLGGLHLGAAGLAAQILTMQFAAAGFLQGLAVRSLKLSFWRQFRQQFTSFALLFVSAGVSRWMSNELSAAGISKILSFLFAGVLYTVAAVLFVWIAPGAFGIRRSQLQRALCIFSAKINITGRS